MGYSDENFRSDAPWNDRSEKVLVRVTQTLVCDFEVEVNAGASEDEIREAARRARLFPDAAIVIATGDEDWDATEKIEVI